MIVYKYNSYEEYVAEQTRANHKKLHYSWVSKTTMKAITNRVDNIENILCHGSRRGTELEYFLECCPTANIIGTDISDTATKFSNTVQHDFHEVNEDWIGTFDIVYSNSFDHSYDPIKALDTWIAQLNDTGVLCVELMDGYDNESTKMDPLEIAHDEYIELINERGHEVFYDFDIKAPQGISRCYMSRKTIKDIKA